MRWHPDNPAWEIELSCIEVDDHQFIDGEIMCEHVFESYPPWLQPMWFNRHRLTSPDGSLGLTLYYGNIDDRDAGDDDHYTLFSSMSVTFT